MKTTFHAPLHAARTFLVPSDLRMIHDAAANHGGLAGAAVQLATVVPIRRGEILAALIEDVDFENGILRIPRKSLPDTQVALGQIGLEIVTAAAGGRLSGSLFDAGGRTGDRIDGIRLPERLVKVDPRLAGLRWHLHALRLCVVQIMRDAGVPHLVVEAQCGRTASSPDHDVRRKLDAQKAAADVTAAALGLFTRSSNHSSPSGRLTPIDHIRAVRRLLESGE